MSFIEHYVASSADGVRLHAVGVGAGPAVVLLHGWPQTWWRWRRVMTRLSDRYRLVAVDLRGLGDSGRAPGGFDTPSLAGVDAAFNRRQARSPLSLPTLTIAGRDGIGSGVACSVSQAVADVRSELLDDCGHYPADEAPDEVARLLGDFLA